MKKRIVSVLIAFALTLTMTAVSGIVPGAGPAKGLLRQVYVSDVAGLRSAVSTAIAGDEIIVAPGKYDVSNFSGSRGGIVQAIDRSGTANNPILLRSEDPKNPAHILSTKVDAGIVVHIFGGDYWIVQDLKVQGGQKGILFDNSDYSIIRGCYVYGTGQEAIHLRDGSSYCTVISNRVTDTGLSNAGYGEGIYIGNADYPTNYDFKCDYNTISHNVIGPNVAADCVDIKEGSTGTIVEYNIMYAEGCTGANTSTSHILLRGNDCIIRYNEFYRDENPIIRAAIENWSPNNDSRAGQRNQIYGNTFNLDDVSTWTGANPWPNRPVFAVGVWSGNVSVSDNVIINPMTVGNWSQMHAFSGAAAKVEPSGTFPAIDVNLSAGLLLDLPWTGTSGLTEPEKTDFIVIDQFGYRPDSQKTAVIRNPKKGADAALSFTPGNNYSVINELTGETAFSGKPVHKFAEDTASGDEIWWFDFSALNKAGRYYILDTEKKVRSFSFAIADNVYNEVLKHAVRMFFYQRAGFAKTAEYAGESWADGASHLQDKQARYFYDKNNAATTRDLSGGWYDAGDYNKYTPWTSRYIEELLEAYRQNPAVFTDDYNIPESGNGIPDIIDEAKWGMEHLLKLQNDGNYRPTVLPSGYPNNVTSYDGSMLSVMALSGTNASNDPASPPSTATGVTLYGPPNTTSAYNAARAFALGAVVFETFDPSYAEVLKSAALRAWKWAEANPNVMFSNNVSSNGSSGLAAGNQEVESDAEGSRTENRVKASFYLYELTGDKSYLSIFENNYQVFPLYEWWGTMDHYRTSQHLMYFQYMNFRDANPTLVNQLKNGWTKPPEGWFSKGMIESFNDVNGNYVGKIDKDGYRSHLKDYPWGSNRAKSDMGLTFYLWEEYDIEPAKSTNYKSVAEDYLHYIHGVNPFNWVYLTNMNAYGASKSITSIYHNWFDNGSAKWSKVGVSTYGPAPGFLPGGANSNYNVQSGFPNSLGGYTPTKEEMELGTHIRNNIVGSPPAKMYVDINHSWPINSWEITEPSCGYQTAYIRLLSLFAQPADVCDECSQSVCICCSECKKLVCVCTPCRLGHVLDRETIAIADAVEILKYLAGLESVIKEGNKAWNASLITGGTKPIITDAIEILKFLANLPCVFNRS